MRIRTTVCRWILSCAMVTACAGLHAQSDWPDWDGFVNRFVQADGRVIDITFERKSTSEGQSYALFFALVANQRARFDTVLRWTSDNLAGGRLGPLLPAWLWGQRPDGSWGVKDGNAASDADLWIAYTLLEAARLWQAPGYAETGRQLLAQIGRLEVAQAGSAGPVLLPGPMGFVLDKGRYRLNPSYLPGFMFRYLALADPRGPWQSIWDSHLRMTPQIYASGIAPDTFVVDSSGVVMADTEREPSASYDGIRVYLWAGMSGPGSAAMVQRLKPYADWTRKLGVPPEKVNPVTGVALKSDYSPIGFSAALLPFLHALADTPTLQRQRQRVDTLRAAQRASSNYYDEVLVLFGKGWLDGRYRFDDDGRLQPRWQR